jgi:hypothetical protein
VDAGAPEQPERGSGVDSRPGLRDLYTDDPDDIFDAGEDPGPGLKGEPGDGAGERVVGEPSSDGPVDGGCTRTRWSGSGTAWSGCTIRRDVVG